MTTPDSKKKLLARLRRAEGQLAAVRRMVEEDAYCIDTMVQIAAVRGALSKAADALLEDHLEHCVRRAFEGGDEVQRRAHVDELLTVFARFGGRG
jgi:CsoR family transcriptional regulator, copper-sensing transcriptional repressor